MIFIFVVARWKHLPAQSLWYQSRFGATSTTKNSGVTGWAAPGSKGKTKNDHFLDLFDGVVAAGNVLDSKILFDFWYAGSTNLKRIYRAGWTFFTTLKMRFKHLAATG